MFNSRLLAVVLALCLPSWASISFVQAKSASTASGFTVTATPGATLTSGNWVVAVGYCSSTAQVLSVSNAGTALTWSTKGPFDGTSIRMMVFYAQVTAANVTSVTFSRASGANILQLYVLEVSGMGAGDTFDQGVVQTNEVSASLTHDIATPLATTVANELVVGLYASGSSATVYSAGANMNLIDVAQSASVGVYRIVTSTGSYTTPVSTSTTRQGTIIGASFKGAVVVGTKNCTLTLMGAGPC